MNYITIRLEKIRFFARHGVFEHERRDGNEFEVNLCVEYPSPEVSLLAEDDLEHTISYVDLYNLVKEEMEKPQRLLETVASSILKRIKSEFPQTTSTCCKITKLSPPIPGFIGKVSVELKD